MSLRRLRSIVHKETLHLVRDRRTLATIITLPILQLMLFGYLSNDVYHIPTVVLDQSRSPESRHLLNAFVNTTYVDLRYEARGFQDITRLIDSGRAKIGIIIPPDYAQRIASGRTATVGVIVDASEPTSARTVLSVAAQVGQHLSTELALSRTARETGARLSPLPVDIRARAWYNPDLRNVDFVVPGLIAVILMFVTTFQAVTLMVRERERGTMEQLVVTPVTGLELMLGKVLPLIVLGYIGLTITTLLAHLWFGMPIKGSLLELYVFSLAYFFSTLGIGVLISTVSRTYQQATQMSQLVFLPSILLSGFFFPRESLPSWLQVAGDALPLTYYMVVIRGILVKGIGLVDIWRPVVILAGLGSAVFGVALLRFRKRID